MSNIYSKVVTYFFITPPRSMAYTSFLCGQLSAQKFCKYLILSDVVDYPSGLVQGCTCVADAGA